MILFAAFIVVGIALFLLSAWILAVSARLLKSPRGRFSMGLVAVTTMTAISIGVVVAMAQLGPALNPTPNPNRAPLPIANPNPAAAIALPLVLGALQLGIAFVVLQRVFALRFLPALGLFGIYVLSSVIQLVLAVGVVRPFVAEAFVIPTPSMAPTVIPNDRLLANKLRAPKRWDLVIYHPPGSPGVNYCKRLIGLPGERLRFQDGNLYVNDQMLVAPAVIAGRLAMPSQLSRYHDGQTIVLANDEFFVVGDNVNLSYDSRFAGPSKWPSIIGVVDLLYWPMNRFRFLN